MDSIWAKDLKKPKFDLLKKDIKTDVLIIGGGITGVLCAYMLKSAGVDCIVAEADKLCGGVTRNTTAKITAQHGLIYSKITKEYGKRKAALYLKSQQAAIEKYRSMMGNIDCDFSDSDSFVYSLNNRMAIENEISAIEKIGGKAEFVSDLPLPLKTVGAVKMSGQAQFNPLKFLFHISGELNIYENTRIIELNPQGAVTNHGVIRSRKVIVTTHFPFLNKHGGYFLKMYQHRSYVIALKNAPKLGGMFVDENLKGLSFRNYGDILLLGGGSHRTGKKGGGWQELELFAKQNYPKAEIVSRFATQDCMTLDGIPYIGQYSANTPDLYVATGFNKWGMTSAMTAANLLSALLTDKPCEYAELYSPQRSILHPQLLINAAESTIGLLTPTAPRCPHLGCALKYNRQEHSWDCSCHGSRFAEDGKVLNNPANGDKNMI